MARRWIDGEGDEAGRVVGGDVDEVGVGRVVGGGRVVMRIDILAIAAATTIIGDQDATPDK